MDNQQTCGTGLADHSRVPAKLAAFLSAMSSVLEHHMKSLDPSEESARAEREAYGELVEDHRDLAERLASLARRMEGYRTTLPAAPHDESVLVSREAADAFREYVKAEQELLASLEQQAETHREMLGSMS